MEDLLARHRKELRDLQSRITAQKKAATKKTRRAVANACDALEAETRARHARQVQQLLDPSAAADADGPVDSGVYIPPSDPDPDADADAGAGADADADADAGAGAALSILSPDPDLDADTDAGADDDDADSKATPPPLGCPTPPPSSSLPAGSAKKPNRQKARLARRAAEAAAASKAAALEAAAQPNLRERELVQMAALLEQHSLQEHQIVPDGHCLYSAFAHSLRLAAPQDAVPADYRAARQRCAAFMAAHRSDFEPFLAAGDFAEHVRRVAATAEWGGHTELLALARAFGVRVNVLQAQGRAVERINAHDSAATADVWLGYYRHAFGLGEHYNSLAKRAPPSLAGNG